MGVTDEELDRMRAALLAACRSMRDGGWWSDSVAVKTNPQIILRVVAEVKHKPFSTASMRSLRPLQAPSEAPPSPGAAYEAGGLAQLDQAEDGLIVRLIRLRVPGDGSRGLKL
jgi:hypothetical protein